MDDDEDYELVRSKPSDPPPLQRLWKSPPEPEEEVEAGPPIQRRRTAEPAKAEPSPSVPKKKKKKTEEVIDDGTGAIKLEETPALDTYEARQRARWIIGGVMVTIVVVIGLIISQAFKGGKTEEIVEAEPVENRAGSENRARLEREAQVMLEMAREFDKKGKDKLAVDELERLVESYTNTAASREAMHALDRHRQNKSLFGEDAPTQLSGPKPPPPGSGTAPGPAVAGGPSSAADVSKKNPPPPPPVTRPLPIGYRPNFSHPIDSSGWPTRIICDIDEAELVLVSGTRFIMGRDDGPVEERPAHEVFVSTYYIDLHEVTAGQYLRFLKEKGRSIKGIKGAEDMPIVNVSYSLAKEYCTWAKRRLPTEAQWELAARGPDGLISYWREELPRPDPEKGDRPMAPVMSLKDDVSPYGAIDLGANAWEWTSDYFDSKYYTKSRNLVSDPTGPKDPLARIAVASVRGGSKQGILTWRDGQKIETKESYIGFRGALPVEGAPIAPPAASAPSNGAPGLKGGVQPF